MTTLPDALQRVVFFADASPRIGAGHQMRGLALAEELLRHGASVMLAARSTLPVTEAAWRAAGADVFVDNCLDHCAVVDKYRAAWCVLDDYAANDALEERLRAKGVDVLAFDDDHHARHGAASLVLNPAARSHDEYDMGPTSLVGLEYALIRSSFRRLKRIDAIADDRCVLVTLGATDPGGFTVPVVLGLRAINLPVLVTVPQSSAHAHPLAAAGARLAIGVDLAHIVESAPSPLVAVSAASTSALELASAGCALVLAGTTANQRAIFDKMMHERVVHGGVFKSNEKIDVDKVVVAVDELWRNQELAREVGTHANKMVDGYGAKRVVCMMSRCVAGRRHQ